MTALISLIAALAVQAAPATGQCSFAYTQAFRARTIEPELTDYYPDIFQWNAAEPIIRIRGSSVELVFLATNLDLVDAPQLLVVVEQCGAGPVRSRLLRTRPADRLTTES